jgi:hypothetical protein
VIAAVPEASGLVKAVAALLPVPAPRPGPIGPPLVGVRDACVAREGVRPAEVAEPVEVERGEASLGDNVGAGPEVAVGVAMLGDSVDSVVSVDGAATGAVAAALATFADFALERPPPPL